MGEAEWWVREPIEEAGTTPATQPPPSPHHSTIEVWAQTPGSHPQEPRPEMCCQVWAVTGHVHKSHPRNRAEQMTCGTD